MQHLNRNQLQFNNWTTFGSITIYIGDYIKLQMTREHQAKLTIQAELCLWKPLFA